MRYLLMLIAGLATHFGICQNEIQKVEFLGLKKTKEFYIRKYLELSEGDLFDSVALKKDIQSMHNLQLFSSIKYDLTTTDSTVYITYELKEKITLLPITNFGGIRDNFYIQLGFSNYNWLGRGGRLSMYYMYYDRHSISTSMYIPYLGQTNYGLSINVNKYSTLEPLFFEEGTVFYEYDNKAIEILGVKEFKLNHTIAAGGTFFNETYNKNSALDYPNSPGPVHRNANKYLAKIVHDWRDIDYYYHYLNGLSNYTFLENVWTAGIKATFVKFVNETKYYRRVGASGNLAGRFKVGLSTNDVGPFAPFVLDSYVNIRGVGNRVDRGTGTLILNLEYRQTVWQPSWGALQAVVFSDVGTWRLDGKPIYDLFDLNNAQTFVGFGGRLVLNQIYNSVLRFDFGIDFNDVDRNGIVVGLGQYF